jgi:hypothetical protein
MILAPVILHFLKVEASSIPMPLETPAPHEAAPEKFVELKQG